MVKGPFGSTSMMILWFSAIGRHCAIWYLMMSNCSLSDNDLEAAVDRLVFVTSVVGVDANLDHNTSLLLDRKLDEIQGWDSPVASCIFRNPSPLIEVFTDHDLRVAKEHDVRFHLNKNTLRAGLATGSVTDRSLPRRKRCVAQPSLRRPLVLPCATERLNRASNVARR